MINKFLVQSYCNDDITQIENYELAINDNTQTWECHYRRETDEGLSVKQLVEQNLYFHRPTNELIFLTKAEHTRLHNHNRQSGMYGRKHSEETKRKQSESHKGITTWNKGKNLSEEHKKHLSESIKRKNIEKKQKEGVT